MTKYEALNNLNNAIQECLLVDIDVQVGQMYHSKDEIQFIALPKDIKYSKDLSGFYIHELS